MNEFLSGQIPIDKFIEHHNKNFIYYCEVVIHPNGNIEYCIPSHQQTLLRISGLSIDEAWNSNIELEELTGCISVWYNHVIKPSKITEVQQRSLNKLQEAGCICIGE